MSTTEGNIKFHVEVSVTKMSVSPPKLMDPLHPIPGAQGRNLCSKQTREARPGPWAGSSLGGSGPGSKLHACLRAAVLLLPSQYLISCPGPFGELSLSGHGVDHGTLPPTGGSPLPFEVLPPLSFLIPADPFIPALGPQRTNRTAGEEA